MFRRRNQRIEDGAERLSVRTLEIEGQEVRCYESDGHRLWRCECPAFQRRVTESGAGYCGHTAVAIMRGLEEGWIKL